MMPSVKDVYPGDGDPNAVPGFDPTPQPKVDETWDRLEVDGETFAVRYDGRGEIEYEWLSGPHPYGFSLSGPRHNPTVQEHLRNSRGFLADIDPDTGYLRED